MGLLIGLVILLVVTLGIGLVIGVRSAAGDRGQTAPSWIHRLDNFFAGLRWVGYKWLRLSELFFAVLTAAVLIVLLIIILPVARRQTIDIQPIAVLKYLADRGYTSEVATERLRDAIDRIIFQAGSSMEPPHFMSSAPDIVIHEVWLQPEAIAAWLGNWLHLRRQDISGEITMADGGNGCGELRLRVRFNGESFPGSESTVALKAVNTPVLPLVSQLTNEAIDSSALGLPNEEIDKLFNAAADGILELTNPYFVAASCFTYNPDEREISREILDRIVATRPETGEATAEEVARAHDVLGVLDFSDDYKYKHARDPATWGKNAVDELRLAIKADPDLSNLPHYLASIIYEQARNEKRALNKGYGPSSDYKAKVRQAAALFNEAVTING
jgi:hypothetical protein